MKTPRKLQKLLALLVSLALLLTSTGTIIANADPPPVDEEEMLIEFLRSIGLDEGPAELYAALILPYEIAELVQLYDAVDLYLNGGTVELDSEVALDTEALYLLIVTTLLLESPDLLQMFSEAIVLNITMEEEDAFNYIHDMIFNTIVSEEEETNDKLELLADVLYGVASLYCSAVTESIYLDILDELEMADDEFMREYFAEFISAIAYFYLSNLAVLNPELPGLINNSLNNLISQLGLQALFGINQMGFFGSTLNVVNMLFSGCIDFNSGCMDMNSRCGNENFDPDYDTSETYIPDTNNPAVYDTSILNEIKWVLPSSRYARSPVFTIESVSALDEWRIYELIDDDWLSVSVEGNTFVLTAERNKSGSARDGTFIVADETNNKFVEFTVEQGKNYDLDYLFDNTASDEYNHTLATFAMELSYAVYNPPPNNFTAYNQGVTTEIDEIEDLLDAYEFDNMALFLDELKQPCLTYSVGHVIAHKYIEVGSDPRPLIVVAIRGTSHIPGWVANITALLASGSQDLGFNGAANMVRDNLKAYMVKYNITDPIMLITGHSKGASVSNVLAHKLNAGLDGVDPNKVYAYTFATVPVGPNFPITGDDNIFNVLNEKDLFTYVPYGNPCLNIYNWGRYGISGRAPMDDESGINVRPSHEMPTYMDWMEDVENKDFPWINYTPAES